VIPAAIDPGPGGRRAPGRPRLPLPRCTGKR
jgi:hypothetical protein